MRARYAEPASSARGPIQSAGAHAVAVLGPASGAVAELESHHLVALQVAEVALGRGPADTHLLSYFGCRDVGRAGLHGVTDQLEGGRRVSLSRRSGRSGRASEQS